MVPSACCTDATISSLSNNVKTSCLWCWICPTRKHASFDTEALSDRQQGFTVRSSTLYTTQNLWCRSGPGEVVPAGQLQAARSDNHQCASHTKTSDEVQHVTPPPTAASRQPAGNEGPNSAGTVAWGDLESPTTPSGWPIEAAQLRRRHGRPSDDQREANSRAHQRNGAAASGSKGAVVPCRDAAARYDVCSLQHIVSSSASPIDLLTPSTGAASTVATPTFSEMSEVCDLTQS